MAAGGDHQRPRGSAEDLPGLELGLIVQPVLDIGAELAVASGLATAAGLVALGTGAAIGDAAAPVPAGALGEVFFCATMVMASAVAAVMKRSPRG